MELWWRLLDFWPLIFDEWQLVAVCFFPSCIFLHVFYLLWTVLTVDALLWGVQFEATPHKEEKKPKQKSFEEYYLSELPFSKIGNFLHVLAFSCFSFCATVWFKFFSVNIINKCTSISVSGHEDIENCAAADKQDHR